MARDIDNRRGLLFHHFYQHGCIVTKEEKSWQEKLANEWEEQVDCILLLDISGHVTRRFCSLSEWRKNWKFSLIKWIKEIYILGDCFQETFFSQPEKVVSYLSAAILSLFTRELWRNDVCTLQYGYINIGSC